MTDDQQQPEPQPVTVTAPEGTGHSFGSLAAAVNAVGGGLLKRVVEDEGMPMEVAGQMVGNAVVLADAGGVLHMLTSVDAVEMNDGTYGFILRTEPVE